MKKIKLTQGKFAVVDDDMFDVLNKQKWQFKQGYVTGHAKDCNGVDHAIRMHRIIINCPDGLQVDHIDRDTLNNQRNNLRICTPSQNSMNRKLHRSNTVGYKGVRLSGGKHIQSRICVEGKNIHLGTYQSFPEAARAYDESAIKYHGNFAVTNKSLGLL